MVAPKSRKQRGQIAAEPVWRVLMARTEQHVYYTVADAADELIIETVWALAENAARVCSVFSGKAIPSPRPGPFSLLVEFARPRAARLFPLGEVAAICHPSMKLQVMAV